MDVTFLSRIHCGWAKPLSPSARAEVSRRERKKTIYRHRANSILSIYSGSGSSLLDFQKFGKRILKNKTIYGEVIQRESRWSRNGKWCIVDQRRDEVAKGTKRFKRLFIRSRPKRDCGARSAPRHLLPYQSRRRNRAEWSYFCPNRLYCAF